MARGSAAAWLMAAVLLTSWAASWASARPASVVTQVEAAPSAATPDAAREVEAEVSRLVARSRMPVAVTPVFARDPFSFATPRARAPRPEAAVPMDDAAGANEDADEIVSALTQVDAAPAPSLAGIAEMRDGRTLAVISFEGELHYAAVGAVIAARYRVDAIADGAVHVFDLVSGTKSRLVLQRP